MKVYKFGGASVKDAAGVKNLAHIVKDEKDLFIIVSAMGKMTNALEVMLELFYTGRRAEALMKMQEIVDYHNNLMEELWNKPHMPARIAKFYTEMEEIISTLNPEHRPYEIWYDLIVSYGELLSTSIISEYLNSVGIANEWINMQQTFVTSDRHKDANIDIERSAERLKKAIDVSGHKVFIGQGFIGATEEGVPTTIGREGSDYSAAVAGYILDAEGVAIWKDVKGILNGDPKIFENVQHIPELTYADAIELAYSGAQIIHPKTIKPLQNKNIPLYVKCFADKSIPGSVIKKEIAQAIDIPILILKKNQILLTIRPLDMSFVLEERLAELFELFGKYHVKLNVIQSSAISLSVCIDNTRYLDEITAELREKGFKARYNTDMELLTIRGYSSEQYTEYGESDNVYLIQRTRRSLRIVRKRQQ